MTRWQAIGGLNSSLGAPTSPESTGDGAARYVRLPPRRDVLVAGDRSATRQRCHLRRLGALGYEHGALGLPTSGEFQSRNGSKQNFRTGR